MGQHASVVQRHAAESRSWPDPCLQAIVDSLAKADALAEALPMVDAWLQQQEEALHDDSNTRVPLQVGGWVCLTASRGGIMRSECDNERAEREGRGLRCCGWTAASGLLPQRLCCTHKRQHGLPLHLPQLLTTLMDTAARTENTHVVLQVLARMARIGVLPSPQVCIEQRESPHSTAL